MTKLQREWYTTEQPQTTNALYVCASCGIVTVLSTCFKCHQDTRTMTEREQAQYVELGTVPKV